MANPWKAFVDIFSDDPVVIGTVTAVYTYTKKVQLVGGGVIMADGDAELNDKVFVKKGLIIDKAPDLPLVEVTIYPT